jgi:hypothetical protein
MGFFEVVFCLLVNFFDIFSNSCVDFVSGNHFILKKIACD